MIEFQVIHYPSGFDVKFNVKLVIGLFKLSGLNDYDKLLSNRPLLSSERIAPKLQTYENTHTF